MDDNTSVLEELIQKNGVGTGTLDGVEGNAYSLLGYTQKRLRRAGWPREDIDVVMKISQSGDYHKVIRTCMAVLDGEE
mgnify:CR=1 FL=1